jgi:hypothetical protein|tara:strand:- start:326 stop:613 length:288 start_codon:yes stop_codon:yes gene_type:complete
MKLLRKDIHRLRMAIKDREHISMNVPMKIEFVIPNQRDNGIKSGDLHNIETIDDRLIDARKTYQLMVTTWPKCPHKREHWFEPVETRFGKLEVTK